MAKPPGETRAAILAAAAAEFAAEGFAGASVDAIAARARVNKAMIYYHFKGKDALYVAVLHEVFSAIGARVASVAASDAPPREKLLQFIDALNAEAESRAYLPPIMAREMAEGARHLDADTLRLMSRLFASLRVILDQGAHAGVFRPTNPLLAYFSLISPIIFYRVAAPVRDAIRKQRVIDMQPLEAAPFIEHLKSNALRALAPDPPARAARRPARPARRPSRRGDHE